ncbi:unnamed protein product, partial [marine sediment metagenome]
MVITADTPPSGEQFNMWIGDVGYHAGVTTLSENIYKVAQIDDLTPGGTIEVGDKFKVTLTDSEGQNGEIETAVATGTTVAQVCQDIVTAVNNSTQTKFQAVTAYLSGSPATNVQIKADTAGVPFYCTIATTENDDSPADGQTFTLYHSTLNNTPPDDNTLVSSVSYVMPNWDATVTATYRDEECSEYCLDWWPKTDQFNQATFGAEKEGLVYDYAGSTLSFQSDYEYESKNGAFLSCETNLPAK